jgi:hypothetical protein
MNSKGFDRYNIYRCVLFKGFSKAFKLQVLFSILQTAPQAHSRVTNINCNIGEGEGSHYYFQEKFPTVSFLPN